MTLPKQSSETTSVSLVTRVRKRDGDAWDRFANIYGPMVYQWAREAGLQESDSADTMQEVFRSVANGIDGFRGDKSGESLRGWLWAITRNHLRRHFTRVNKQPQAFGGSSAQLRFQELPDTSPTESDSSQHLSISRVAHRALAEIQCEFNETTWSAFWRMAVRGQTGAEVAAGLSISENNARQCKYRVLCRLRELMAGN